jgi:hypothetical protein
MAAKIIGQVINVDGSPDRSFTENCIDPGQKEAEAPKGRTTPYVREGVTISAVAERKPPRHNMEGGKRKTPVIEVRH